MKQLHPVVRHSAHFILESNYVVMYEVIIHRLNCHGGVATIAKLARYEIYQSLFQNWLSFRIVFIAPKPRTILACT